MQLLYCVLERTYPPSTLNSSNAMEAHTSSTFPDDRIAGNSITLERNTSVKNIIKSVSFLKLLKEGEQSVLILPDPCKARVRNFDFKLTRYKFPVPRLPEHFEFIRTPLQHTDRDAVKNDLIQDDIAGQKEMAHEKLEEKCEDE